MGHRRTLLQCSASHAMLSLVRYTLGIGHKA